MPEFAVLVSSEQLVPRHLGEVGAVDRLVVVQLG